MGGVSFFRIGDNVELWRVVVQLSVLLVIVISFEQLTHKAERALHKYPKYHEMLTKIYRELMILGMVGLGVKVVKEAALVDGYGKNMLAFQAADLVIFISAVALIIQAIGVFALLRAKNKQLDREELLSTADLASLVALHQAQLRGQSFWRRLWPWTPAPARNDAVPGSSLRFSTARYDEMIRVRVLRHFFLRTYGLPGLFPFSKYLRQAQDNQITHMIDVELSMWILLILLTWLLDASTVLLEHVHRELERHALVSMFLVFAWTLTLLHFLMTNYLSRSLKKILHVAGYRSHQDVVPLLGEIAREETQQLTAEGAEKALDRMLEVQEAQEMLQAGKDRKYNHCVQHDTGLQMLVMCSRKLCRRAKSGGASTLSGTDPGVSAVNADDDGRRSSVKDESIQRPSPPALAPLPQLEIRFFSRKALHFLVKFLLMLNGFYFAFMCQAVAYELPEVYQAFGVVPMLMIPLPLLINMFIFQPQICRNFILVSSVFKVDPGTLSEVVTHFRETIELRSDFVSCLLESMRVHGLTAQDLHVALANQDPQGTGRVELEELRQVLREFGCQVSFFRFNSIAKLLFRLHGAKVEYEQVERLLTLAEEEDRRTSMIPIVGERSPATATTVPNPHYPRFLHSVMTDVVESHRREQSIALSRVSHASHASSDAFVASSANKYRPPQHREFDLSSSASSSHFGLPTIPSATTTRNHPTRPRSPVSQYLSPAACTDGMSAGSAYRQV